MLSGLNSSRSKAQHSVQKRTGACVRVCVCERRSTCTSSHSRTCSCKHRCVDQCVEKSSCADLSGCRRPVRPCVSWSWTRAPPRAESSAPDSPTWPCMHSSFDFRAVDCGPICAGVCVCVCVHIFVSISTSIPLACRKLRYAVAWSPGVTASHGQCATCSPLLHLNRCYNRRVSSKT